MSKFHRLTDQTFNIINPLKDIARMEVNRSNIKYEGRLKIVDGSYCDVVLYKDGDSFVFLLVNIVRFQFDANFVIRMLMDFPNILGMDSIISLYGNNVVMAELRQEVIMSLKTLNPVEIESIGMEYEDRTADDYDEEDEDDDENADTVFIR